MSYCACTPPRFLPRPFGSLLERGSGSLARLGDAELAARIARLARVVEVFEPAGAHPVPVLALREKAHFVLELDRLRREMMVRRGLPVRSRPAPSDTVPPVRFDFDATGDRGGRRGLHRVYCSAEQVAAVTRRLRRVFGHDRFQVIAVDGAAGES